MKVEYATIEDLKEWFNLASEVEYLFGPMVDDPDFIVALKKNINRKTAFCIRKNDGPSGSPLLGACLWSSKPPIYKINWLSVAQDARGSGVATALINYLLNLVKVPGEIEVTTFGEDIKEGLPARRLYQKFGFKPLNKVIPNGPEGGSRQTFKRFIL